ncbi:penicillin acylase family protein [Polynucleobacter sp. IMCC 30228]|uniref:penicillin acylase family protein n=1 Tax=Polynucleobacter sp. IMCC 30228 TaxID=2781011 RepID=UPI001F26E9EE|nr:penicillin acylase family protein [Polynucleobacter sp. IMCC 30228]MCE7527781.1 penicillin acylase family protein [Polynucleobacter sp. IMCC 30228]
MIQSYQRSRAQSFWRITLFSALALITVLVIIVATYLLSAHTELSGKRVIQGLNEAVSIQFDTNEIPHIKAKNPSDALFALGYLHASERSWQMEINRRLAAGRLSEILGEETVKIDRFMRTLGIKRAAENQLERYPIEAKRLLQAYADGVNAGNTNLGWALPLEYFLTRSKPGYFSAADSVAWMLVMALDLGGNWQKELQRLGLAQYLTTAQVWEVMPPYPDTKPVSNVDFSKLYQDLQVYPATKTAQTNAATVTQDKADLQLSHFLPGGKDGIGSNNWVISGNKTASGKPLLANDPHLGLSAPSAWYFVHIDAPKLQVIGATMPGIPAVIIGRTKQIAWGFTNTNPDVQDLYLEQFDLKSSGLYRGPDGPLPFRVREEIIDIKGENSFRFIVKESRHGPIISDAYELAKNTIDAKRYALALRWTALDLENQSLATLLDMNRAESIDELKNSLRHFYAPMQNIVMADTLGNIALQVAGVAPKRTLYQGLYGIAPVPGWDRQYDWTSYIPFDQLPAITNPTEGWLASANQQILADYNSNPLTADWELPFRYDRIKQLLEAQNKHDLNSMRAIQGDTLSLGATPLLELFKSVQSTHPLSNSAKQITNTFAGDMVANSAAPTIFNAWVDQLTRLLFSRLGDLFKQEYGKRRQFREALILQLANPNSPWCDQPSSTTVENCAETAKLAYDLALDQLSSAYGPDPQKWLWGQAHLAVAEHRPFSKVPLLNKIFNLVNPFPGDSFSVNVGRLELGKSASPFNTKQAASMRIIFDFANLDQSTFIYPTGQSGWVQSSRYRNLNALWANNEALPLTSKPTSYSRQLDLAPK